MDDYFQYKAMSSEKSTGSSSSTDHVQNIPSEDSANAETGCCANVISSIFIGLLVLIPVSWPFLLIYWYNRTRSQRQNYNDVENPPIGSTSEPLGYVESDISDNNSVVIKLKPNIEGDVQYKLDDDGSFKSCHHGYKISGLTVGQHDIIFLYTATGFYEPQQKFIVWPTITTNKDTATVGLDTDTAVNGTFQYKLDDSEQFLQCVDKDKSAGLSVGHHTITFQFTPTDESQPSCTKSHEFIICPTYTIISSITTDKDDTATIHLDTNPKVNGTFQYKLDDSEQFQQCSSENHLMLPKLSAGVHCIVLKFTPTGLPETFSTSENFQFEVKPTAYYSVSANGEAELNSNTPGKFAMSADGAVLKQCSDSDKFDLASFEHHTINIQFTPIGSQTLCLLPLELIRCPDIIPSFTTDKDTATIHLDTKPKVSGTFQYKLDGNKQLQQCLSEFNLPKLSAGTHHIVFHFIPNDLPEAHSTTEEYQFEIEPTAHCDISVNEDGFTYTANLYSNTKGIFTYSLDGKNFQKCMEIDNDEIFKELPVGYHKIHFRFTPTGSSQPLPLTPQEFIIYPTILSPSITPGKDNKDTVTIHLEIKPKIKGTFQYKLDDSEQFQKCSSEFNLSKLSAGTHRIVFTFTPTHSPKAAVVSQEHQFDIEITAYGSVSFNQDTPIIELYSNTEGTFEFSLDGEDYKQCNHGYPLDNMTVGHHTINFLFTPTGSTQLMPPQPHNFIMRPTIISSVDTDQDRAILHLDIKPKVDGTFWYRLNNNKTFQQCPSDNILQKLSAGTHQITFKFIPTNSPKAFSISEEHYFEIKPTARGSVIVEEDTATIKELYSNTKGTFKYSLDESTFQKCVVGKKFTRLTFGTHTIIMRFTTAKSHEEIPCSQSSDLFEVKQIAEVSITPVEDDVIMKMSHNFSAILQYSLDGADFQPCDEADLQSFMSEKKFSRLLAGNHCAKVKFIPNLPSPETVKTEQIETVEKSKNFTIPLKAKGSVTISKDKAVMNLKTNSDRKFQYSLDDQPFEKFESDTVPYENCFQEITMLTAGKHSLKIQLDSSDTLVLKPPIPFTVLSKDWYAAHCRPIGLQNLGNTCFFNSALQSTLKTDVFHDFPLKWEYEQEFAVSSDEPAQKKPKETTKPYTKSYEVPSKTSDTPLKITVPLLLGPLTEALINLLRNTSTNTVTFPPRNLLGQLGKRNSRFVQRTQEDSHEALRCMLDAIKNEEIDQVKKAIKEHFGAIDSRTEATLDGEAKLKMKGYLRMASKVPTIIGEVVEGKIISVTICHECLDVSENLESFFDISLPMPEENWCRYENKDLYDVSSMDSLSSSGSSDYYSDDNGNSLKTQPTNRQDQTTLESDASDTKPNVNVEDQQLHKLHNMSLDYEVSANQQHTSPGDQNASLTTGADQQSETPNSEKVESIHLTEPEGTDAGIPAAVMPTSETKPNVDVGDQKLHSVSPDYEVSANQQHTPPGDQNDSLTTGADQQSGTPSNDKIEDVHPTESEGTDTSTSGVAMPGIATTSDTENKLEQHVVSAEGASVHVDSSNEEIVNSPQKPLASQEAEQEDQRAKSRHARKEKRKKKLITHKKNEFQKYLIKKRLNYQSKGKQEEGTDLQICLSAYTDLDVLDEDNKFICQACTRQNQSTNMEDEPVLCRVSKQIMIHQLPPILILHMKRFEIGWDQVTKDDRHITFSEVLDIAPYCTDECVKRSGDSGCKILYGLYAVVVHQGARLQSGHYIAFVKTRPTEEKNKLDKDEYKDGWYYDEAYCKKGQWYYTSDSHVQECSFEEVKGNKAYMLFYERLPIVPKTLSG